MREKIIIVLLGFFASTSAHAWSRSECDRIYSSDTEGKAQEAADCVEKLSKKNKELEKKVEEMEYEISRIKRDVMMIRTR